jgi:hypothetical protein
MNHANSKADLVPGKHYRFGVATINPSGRGQQAWEEEKLEP